MKLYLVRHGETEANYRRVFQGWLNWSLNTTGQSQARWLGEQLQDQQFYKMYTSPLARTAETLQIIVDGQAGSPAIQEVPALKEMNFGRWEGLSSAEIEERDPEYYQKWLEDWQQVPTPEGESASQLYQRVTSWLKKTIEATEADANLLIVSHEGVILQIIAHLLGLGMDGSWHFRVRPGSLSVVEIHDGFASLTLLNHHQGELQ